MKHEDFRLRYNEIMFDERDLIIDFLRKQADLRYGNLMFEWSLNDVKVFEADGDPFIVDEIALLSDDRLKIRGTSIHNTREQLNPEELALGELSKIIDALPDAESIVYKNAIEDMKVLIRDYNIMSLLRDYPFVFKSGKSTFKVHDVFKDKSGKLNFVIDESLNGSTGSGVWEELDVEDAKNLANHIKASVLKCSMEYGRLKYHLNCFGGNLYNFCETGNAGSIYITPAGTDLQLMVLDVSMENGSLEVLVSIAETKLADSFNGEDTLLLKEKDLTPENIKVINQFFDEPDKSLVELSDEQKVLVKKFKDICAELSKAKVGIVRDDNCSDLLFLNMEHIENLDCSEHVTDKQGWHDITDFLQERLSCITETYFYSQDHERLLAKFI